MINEIKYVMKDGVAVLEIDGETIIPISDLPENIELSSSYFDGVDQHVKYKPLFG